MEFAYVRLVFALPIAIVGIAAALHATGYLHGEAKRRQHWFWFYLIGTLASMGFVVAVDRPLAFLLAWEAMGLFSAGLVGFESETKESQRATWIYLLACQAGALCLMAGWIWGVWGLIFVGFALKIGFPPFHVWLPEAHPTAPAPASAVMSGAMIPLGFYGLWRFGSLAELTGRMAWTLLVFGAIAAIGGILLSLPQRNLKKLLAFSSVENMGVIAIGFAVAGFARRAGCDSVALMAMIGAALHVINHSLLKGALFLGAGSVLRMTGKLDIDALGGLMKRMPWTGSLFAINAFGLAGLPPMNGFVSEALIYIAAIRLLVLKTAVLPSSVALVALALTGGIAAAVYAKAVSGTFLGEARGDQSGVVETPARMIAAISLLTVLSAVVSGMILFAIPVALIVVACRLLLPRGKVHPSQPTWDCGYERPTARMAWTGSAFAQPLADTFSMILRPRKHEMVCVKSDKVVDAAVAVETDDPGISRLFHPLFHSAARLFQRVHLMQNGSLHFYVLIMIIAIAALLTWGAFV